MSKFTERPFVSCLDFKTLLSPMNHSSMTEFRFGSFYGRIKFSTLILTFPGHVV